MCLNPSTKIFEKTENMLKLVKKIEKKNKIPFINSLASARFQGFLEKNDSTFLALRGNFSSPVCSTNPVKVSKDTASLLVCTRKKIFWLGMWVFCELHHKWRTFRPPWPTLPGPGRQLLGGSLSPKFLLETRLQSESFDTLDDLLGFRVQKLWC